MLKDVDAFKLLRVEMDDLADLLLIGPQPRLFNRTMERNSMIKSAVWSLFETIKEIKNSGEAHNIHIRRVIESTTFKMKRVEYILLSARPVRYRRIL